MLLLLEMWRDMCRCFFKQHVSCMGSCMCCAFATILKLVLDMHATKNCHFVLCQSTCTLFCCLCRRAGAWCAAAQQQRHRCCPHQDQDAVPSHWRRPGHVLLFGSNASPGPCSADQCHWTPCNAPLLEHGSPAEQVSGLQRARCFSTPVECLKLPKRWSHGYLIWLHDQYALLKSCIASLQERLLDLGLLRACGAELHPEWYPTGNICDRYTLHGQQPDLHLER